MKRNTVILFAATMLATLSCKTVTPEQQIDSIRNYAASADLTVKPANLDQLTIDLMEKGRIKDIWTVEGPEGANLLAQIPGKKKSTRTILISSCMDDEVACTAAANALAALKALKGKRADAVRAVFYQSGEDSLKLSGLHTIGQLSREEGDEYYFNIELSSISEAQEGIFVLNEPIHIFSKINEVVTPYLAPIGQYGFDNNEAKDTNWPIRANIYKFKVSETNLSNDISAIAAFIYLMD